ncbi:tetratricopeptide repeat protein [Roseateles sp. DB2]|uniref:tetratricopeptide repeat protein n=1 Tax=Roseateles sp. DB2 TaxID=3453717 RepID=UPI003EE93B15
MNPRHPALPRLLALVLAAGLCWSAPARAAGELEKAQQQWLQGHQADAKKTLETALAEDPNNARLRFALALMRMESGETAQAETLLRRLTEDFPDLADPFNNLAVILAARGDMDAAFEALQRAVNLQPEHVQAQENLGDVLLQLAARAYAVAARPGPQSSVNAGLKLRRTQELLRGMNTPVR